MTKWQGIICARIRFDKVELLGTVVGAKVAAGGYLTFFHHYQGSIDYNIVNIHPTEEMYFFVPRGDRDDIE